MAINTDKLKDDAAGILNLLGKITPGGMAKSLAEKLQGNQAEVMKAIRIILSGTAPGRAAEAVKFIVDRYKIPESVAERMVANEMTDLNEGFGPQGPDGTPDDGYRRNIGIDSGAEDYYDVPDKKITTDSKRFPDIDINDPNIRRQMRRQIENLRSKPGRLPGPIDTGERRSDAIRFPDLVGEGDGRTMGERYPGARYMQEIMPMLENEYPYDKDMMIEGPYDSLSIPMRMPRRRVGLAEGTMMASAPDAMDERNQVMEAIAMKQFGKPLNELSEDEIIQIEMMIDEMVKRKDQPREMAQAGGRVGFQTGGTYEEVRSLPPEFIEAAQQTYLTDLATQSGLPSVTTANVKQPGETDAQFAQRQAQATQFGITKAGMAELAPQVAAQDALQTQAYNLGQTGLGSFQPFLTKAGTAADASTALTGTGAGTGAGSIQSYMSPYQQQVIDTTMQDFDKQAQIRANEQAAATLGVPGAFGGGREGVQRAEYQAASDQNRAQTLANLRQSGFQNAAARRQQDLANQMGIANLQGGLGARAQDFSRAQISGLGTLGAAQQAQNQAVLDAQRQAAQMAIDEPRQALSRFGQGIAGITPGAGTIRLSDAPAAAQSSPLMQALGIGLAGADIYGRIF
jgi:hypothetical protein